MGGSGSGGEDDDDHELPALQLTCNTSRILRKRGSNIEAVSP